MEASVDDGVLDEIAGDRQYRVLEAVEIVDIVERPSGEVPDPGEIIAVGGLGAVAEHDYE